MFTSSGGGQRAYSEFHSFLGAISAAFLGAGEGKKCTQKLAQRAPSDNGDGLDPAIPPEEE